MDNKLNLIEENVEYKDEKLSYRTPIYLQLREIIRNRIEEGEYPVSYTHLNGNYWWKNR